MCCLFALSMAACGKENRESVNSADDLSAKRAEWISAIGIVGNEAIDIASFDETDGDVTITFSNSDNKKEMYDAINDVVRSHNSFVQANQDYFVGYTTIKFVIQAPSKDNQIIFYSKLDSATEQELNVEQDSSIMYVQFFTKNISSDILEQDIFFDCPNVIVDFAQFPVPENEDNYKILGNCRNYSKVILNAQKEFDTSYCKEMVQKYSDSAELYRTVFLKNPIKL